MDKKRKQWKRFEHDSYYPPHFDKEAINNSVYAREHITEGYNVSDTNQLIFNFKKAPDRKGKTEWQYKIKAAKQFSIELHGLLSHSNKKSQFVIMTVPVSKLRGNEKHDSRFDMMIEELKKEEANDQDCQKTYLIEEPIILKENMKSSSSEGGLRDVNEIYRYYQWRGFTNSVPDSIILIDDVVTTGSHFMACKKLLREHCPNLNIYGVFWARTFNKQTDDFFKELEKYREQSIKMHKSNE